MRPNEKFHLKNPGTAALPTPSSETDINQNPDFLSMKDLELESEKLVIRLTLMKNVKLKLIFINLLIIKRYFD